MSERPKFPGGEPKLKVRGLNTGEEARLRVRGLNTGSEDVKSERTEAELLIGKELIQRDAEFERGGGVYKVHKYNKEKDLYILRKIDGSTATIGRERLLENLSTPGSPWRYK